MYFHFNYHFLLGAHDTFGYWNKVFNLFMILNVI